MNIKIKRLQLFGILFFGLLLCFSFLSASSIISAQASQQPRIDLQKNAEEFCGAGDGPVQKACRQGFREGYNGNQNKTKACDSSEYNAKEKARCLEGYSAGESDKDKALAVNNNLLSPAEPSGGNHECGKGDTVVKTKFNFGCLGKDAPQDVSPLEDLLYAIIRFLSVGVGIIVVIAIIISGIQYSASEGNAEATQAAKERIRNALIGLLLYLFAFSLVQFLVPGGVFSGSMIVPSALPDIMKVKS